MPTPPKLLKSGSLYHVYNRGVEKRTIFPVGSFYNHFLETLEYYQRNQPVSFSTFRRNKGNPFLKKNAKNIVTILCYCLMPNHYHLILRQITDGGITKYMNDVGNSYARYFNTRNERVGPLFQSRFKAKLIENEESFLQVSRYIHLNPLGSEATHPAGEKNSLISALEGYHYSSYNLFINGNKEFGLCERSAIEEYIKNPKSYKEFVESKINQDPSLGIESLILES